jgi:CheY-like chemotaxis protein
MGLAASYGTVASHGGSIEIASRLGRGTTVSVRLPTLTADAAAVSAPTPRTVVGMGGRALVVDDEDGVREALRHLLESLGFQTTGFARGAEAVTHFSDRASSYDVVILDLVLPDMSGREILAAMREIDPGVKILLVSGYAADEDVLSLVRDGTVGFLEKPFQLADLAESVTRLRG